MNHGLFADAGFSNRRKTGENTCGDVFMCRKLAGENRLLAVLSDGLGSGVKANILSNMTATMALKFTGSNKETVKTAEMIMNSLPVCKVRKISYATFSILDAVLHGRGRIVEMGNPPAMLFRSGTSVKLAGRKMTATEWRNREINTSEFDIMPGDRLVFMSDGVTQAGMGTPKYPLGWRDKPCRDYIGEVLTDNPAIPAGELADAVVREALRKEPAGKAKDDITCGTVYFRLPEKMMLFTGPPFYRERDRECALMLDHFQGSKVICGGTTAKIVGRELNRPVKLNLRDIHSELPPVSEIPGVDLVTEGIFTLSRAAGYLEDGDFLREENGAAQLVRMFMRNDIIEFIVGTRINESHQDPNLPEDLEIRRNIIKRIANLLKDKYLKEVNITCM